MRRFVAERPVALRIAAASGPRERLTDDFSMIEVCFPAAEPEVNRKKKERIERRTP
jgi:hypothetical protein